MHVERRDHVEAAGKIAGGIADLVAHAVGHARLARVRRRALDARCERVVADVAARRKRLRQPNERAPATAADVGHVGAVAQLALDVGHRRHPLLHEQVVEPAAREALHPVPEALVVRRLRDAPARAERLGDAIDD